MHTCVRDAVLTKSTKRLNGQYVEYYRGPAALYIHTQCLCTYTKRMRIQMYTSGNKQARSHQWACRCGLTHCYMRTKPISHSPSWVSECARERPYSPTKQPKPKPANRTQTRSHKNRSCNGKRSERDQRNQTERTNRQRQNTNENQTYLALHLWTLLNEHKRMNRKKK